MRAEFNIYCDESRHLEHDSQRFMLLGALWCSREAVRETAVRLREIKEEHGLPRSFELKWSKASPGALGYYRDVVDLFFDRQDLRFRAVIIEKSKLDHDNFGNDHDGFYYKMFFNLLKVILDPQARYKIYLDLKDTQGKQKIGRLHEVLSNNMLDFQRTIIEDVQEVRSHEVEQIQLCDLLLGAVGYANTYEAATSPAKASLVARIRERSGYVLTRSTLLREEKLNLLVWEPRGGV